MSTRTTAWIVGASSPIGIAITHQLAESGWDLLLQGNRNTAAIEKLQAEITTNYNVEVASFCCDVTDTETLKAQFKDAQKSAIGPVTAMVYNSGINSNGLVARPALTEVDTIVQTNLTAAYSCTSMALRPMLKYGSGSIVYIGSTAGQAGNAGQAAYAMAKAGLHGLTKSVAREYGAKAVRANVVAPGWVHTPMSESVIDEQKESILATIPMGSVASVDQIAQPVKFLLSQDASYITGQILAVNGGLYM